jgi:hypothetical protein
VPANGSVEAPATGKQEGGMMRTGWIVALAAAWLGSALPGAARAEDTFTPLTATPRGAATTPVLGTDGKLHVVYELDLANTRSTLATLEQVRITDDAKPRHTLATYDKDEIARRLRQLNNQAAANAEIRQNEARLLLIDLALEPSRPPSRLFNFLKLTGAGPDVTDPKPVLQDYRTTSIFLNGEPPVIRAPLAGTGWVAFNGCCGPGGAHRATALPVNGALHYAQRFAIDWIRLDSQGRVWSGDEHDVHSYYGYGERVLAVANGTVVETLNNLPDQIPGKLPDPSTITIANVDGNHVVLDLGNGVYAFYAHLQRGSVTVHAGQKVTVGQVLGKLGNTGNTSAPHLHFHLMNGPSVLGSEGIPYVLGNFRLAGNIPDSAVPDDLGGSYKRFLRPSPQPRRKQFPLDLDVIDFTR